jgi:hypothetical protein
MAALSKIPAVFEAYVAIECCRLGACLVSKPTEEREEKIEKLEDGRVDHL